MDCRRYEDKLVWFNSKGRTDDEYNTKPVGKNLLDFDKFLAERGVAYSKEGNDYTLTSAGVDDLLKAEYFPDGTDFVFTCEIEGGTNFRPVLATMEDEDPYDIVNEHSEHVGTKYEIYSKHVGEDPCNLLMFDYDAAPSPSVTVTIKDPQLRLTTYVGGVLTDSSFATENEGIASDLRQRLNVIRNELWYNTQYGVPFGVKKTEMDVAVTDMILGCPDVRSILEFNSKIIDHNYQMTCKILTTFGVVELNA